MTHADVGVLYITMETAAKTAIIDLRRASVVKRRTLSMTSTSLENLLQIVKN